MPKGVKREGIYTWTRRRNTKNANPVADQSIKAGIITTQNWKVLFFKDRHTKRHNQAYIYSKNQSTLKNEAKHNKALQGLLQKSSKLNAPQHQYGA